MENDSELSMAEAAGAFAALGSEQRLMILECLVRAGPDGLAIGPLGERANVSGSTLTHHLKLLAAAGLIVQEKKGRSIVCTGAAFDTVETLSKYLLRNCCSEAGETSEHDHG